MRIKHIRLSRLFDLFDHVVPFNLSDGITIVHGPNGFGKTILLQLIDGFFHQNLHLLSRSPYRELEIEFDNETKVVIHRKENSSPPSKEWDLEISHFRRGQLDANSYNHDVHRRQQHLERLQHTAPSIISDLVPALRRVGPRRWRHRATGEYLTIEEVFERFADRLSPVLPKMTPLPDWLREAMGAINTHLIRANRLTALRNGSDDDEDESEERPAVEVFSTELAHKMKNLLAQSAEVSQQLDRSFPQRVFDQRDVAPPRLQLLRRQLEEIDLTRQELMDVGLIDKAEVAALQLPGEPDRTGRRVLAEYISDTIKKLEVFKGFSSRLRLLTGILNNRFSHKTVIPDRERGFRVVAQSGREVPLLGLSSGEQHELVMFYQLLFQVKENSLILFDEPEISLHVAWQKQFMSDLDRVSGLNKLDVLIATHSPQIIGHRWEQAIKLGSDEVTS